MPPVEFPRAEYAVRRCPVFCSIKLRPSPLSLGTSNYLKAPTPAPSGLSRQDPPNPPPTPHRWEIDDSDDFSRQDPPTPPRNPPPTPRRRQFSIAKDDGWSFEETGNLVLACRSGVSMEWDEIAALFPGKTPKDCNSKFTELQQLEAAASRYLKERESAFSFSLQSSDNEDNGYESDLDDDEDDLDESDLDLDCPPALSRGPSPMPSPMFRRPTPQVSMHYFLGQTGEKDMLQAWTRAIEGLDVELERDRQFYAFA